METIVIKTRVRSCITDNYGWDWYLITSHRERYGAKELFFSKIRLTPAEAKRNINRLGLVRTHKDNDGEVYDTPNEDFRNLCPDGLSRAERRRIDAIQW